MEERPSPNCRERPEGAKIDTLVLHYTGMRNAADAIGRLRDPQAGVSSHYVVDEDGAVLRLVPDALRAAHAGVSFWRGRRDLNDVSIGIEIVNPGHEWGYRPFPAAQIDVLVALCRHLRARHPIETANIVGHSDVAPDRKQDPGELFPWRHLARAGIGIWPEGEEAGDPANPDPADSAAADPDRLDTLLTLIGYPATEAHLRIVAFQRRWRPSRVDGRADRGTARMAEAVCASLGPWGNRA